MSVLSSSYQSALLSTVDTAKTKLGNYSTLTFIVDGEEKKKIVSNDLLYSLITNADENATKLH